MKPLDLQVQEAKIQIIRLAEAKNIDSGVFVAAMADVMGISAATLERVKGSEVDIDTLLDEVITRARAAYHRTRNIMMVTPR